MRGYIGNQGRNRPKGQRHGNRERDGNRANGNSGGRPEELLREEVFDADDSEIISPAELMQSRKSMNLTELKAKPIHELVKVAESMGLENLARSRKQDIIFSILKAPDRDGRFLCGLVHLLQGNGGDHVCRPGGAPGAFPDDAAARRRHRKRRR